MCGRFKADFWAAGSGLGRATAQTAPGKGVLKPKTRALLDFVRLNCLSVSVYDIPAGMPGLEKWGGQTRPAHIHLTVVHPMFVPLTTQLYFKGDSKIKTDPWAKNSKVVVDMKGRQGRIDIVLASGPMAAAGKT